MSKARPIEKHIAAIQSGSIDKTVVIGLRKAFNTFSRITYRYSVSSTQTQITIGEFETVTDLLAEIKPRVVGELHDSGIAMLQSKRYRKQLERYADIIAEIDHFALVGYEEINANRASYFYPVFRARGKSGRSFPFYVVPWQAGGNGPVIASSNYF